MAVFSPSANLVNFDIKTKIESFLKLNTTISKNTNIENLWMSLPNAGKFIPYTENLSEQEKKLWGKDEAYFLREDLVEPTMRILYPEGKYKKIIDALKSFIPQKDTASLLFAADICLKENKKSEFDGELARRKLSEANPRRGSILYNWLRSEEVIPFDLLPFIELKDNFQDKTLFNSLFTGIWEQFLTCHPLRIFVSVEMNEEKLLDEILKRAIFKKSKKIIIYSRGLRNKIVNNLLKNLKVSYSLGNKIKWKVQKKNYNIGLNDAMRVEIIPEFFS
jgi:hypothetical protein